MLINGTNVENETGQLYGELWHHYDDELFKQSVGLFEKRWLANGESPEFFRGKRCLDAGCGGGRYSIAMAQMGAREVIGVDVSHEGLEDARRRASGLNCHNISFREGSVLRLPFNDSQFDFVCCSGILHHTVGIERGLAELHRVLKPGGSVFLLLYGAGGLFWSWNMLMRPFAEILGHTEVDRAIRAAGYQPNKRRSILDGLFCPILETYTKERVEHLLAHAGFEKWRYWTRARLDHESGPETLVAELEVYERLWQSGALSAADPLKTAVQLQLANLCRSLVFAARNVLELHRQGLLSAEESNQAIIGNGHYRLIATRP
jgi:ubiquinone/menaquinone biosynthesis C-methylase UbiE